MIDRLLEKDDRVVSHENMNPYGVKTLIALGRVPVLSIPASISLIVGTTIEINRHECRQIALATDCPQPTMSSMSVLESCESSCMTGRNCMISISSYKLSRYAFNVKFEPVNARPARFAVCRTS